MVNCIYTGTVAKISLLKLTQTVKKTNLVFTLVLMAYNQQAAFPEFELRCTTIIMIRQLTILCVAMAISAGVGA